jgi:hypothetical protein
MRLIKMLGLAAAMTMLVTAILGTASAMAENTTLCKEDTNDNLCPEAKRATKIHLMSQKLENGQLTAAKIKILSNFGTVECVMLYLGDVQNASFLANPLKIIGDFSFTSCGVGCAVYETEGSTGLLEFLKEGGAGSELAKVKGEATFAVDCIFWECEYDFEDLIGHFLGKLTPTHNGHLTYTAAVLHPTGLGLECPEETKLDALLLSLEALYVRS